MEANSILSPRTWQVTHRGAPCSPGHVLSMPHDDSKTCERLFGPLGKHHMMAPLFVHLNKSQPWSPCSAMYLTEFLDGGHGKAQQHFP